MSDGVGDDGAVGGRSRGEWNVEQRGFAAIAPWYLLPRRTRPKAKDDNYLRAGTEIMRELETGGARKFGWLAQGNHAVPDCRAPHTYVFVKAGFGAPFIEGEGPKTQGGGFFRPDEWGSHMAQAGEMGVWVTTARIFAREGITSMLGKIFTRVRVKQGIEPTPKKLLQRKSHLEEVMVSGWGFIAVCHFALELLENQTVELPLPLPPMAIPRAMPTPMHAGILPPEHRRLDPKQWRRLVSARHMGEVAPPGGSAFTALVASPADDPPHSTLPAPGLPSGHAAPPHHPLPYDYISGSHHPSDIHTYSSLPWGFYNCSTSHPPVYDPGPAPIVALARPVQRHGVVLAVAAPARSVHALPPRQLLPAPRPMRPAEGPWESALGMEAPLLVPTGHPWQQPAYPAYHDCAFVPAAPLQPPHRPPLLYRPDPPPRPSRPEPHGPPQHKYMPAIERGSSLDPDTHPPPPLPDDRPRSVSEHPLPELPLHKHPLPEHPLPEHPLPEHPLPGHPLPERPRFSEPFSNPPEDGATPSDTSGVRTADGGLHSSASALSRLLRGGSDGSAFQAAPRLPAHACHTPATTTAELLADAPPAHAPATSNNDRWQPSSSDVHVLERVFQIEPLPGRQARFQLAEHFGVTPRQVQVWFQNKRQRVRVRALKEAMMADVAFARHAPAASRRSPAPRPVPPTLPSALSAAEMRVARMSVAGRKDGVALVTADSGSDHETPAHVLSRLTPARFEGGRLACRPSYDGPAVYNAPLEAAAAPVASLPPPLVCPPPPPPPPPRWDNVEKKKKNWPSEASVMSKLAASNICEKDPLCSRGFRHAGKGGPCSRKRPAHGWPDTSTHARQMVDAWLAMSRALQACGGWLPTPWLLSRCLESRHVNQETATRVRQMFDRCTSDPQNDRLCASFRRVLLATARSVLARAPAGRVSDVDEESEEGEEVVEWESFGSLGQCLKDPRCTRGLRHGGKGGRCSYSLKPSWAIPNDWEGVWGERAGQASWEGESHGAQSDVSAGGDGGEAASGDGGEAERGDGGEAASGDEAWRAAGATGMSSLTSSGEETESEDGSYSESDLASWARGDSTDGETDTEVEGEGAEGEDAGMRRGCSVCCEAEAAGAAGPCGGASALVRGDEPARQ